MSLGIVELNGRLHDRAGFDCGNEALNRYLRSLATQHRLKGIATTFVLVESDRPARVLGFYALSAAALALENLAQADRKGLPAYPVPAVRIGRLAVSLAARQRGFGELLLQNAVRRVLAARGALGVCALVVEAKDATAERFYRKYGFRLCAGEVRQLYLPLGVG